MAIVVQTNHAIHALPSARVLQKLLLRVRKHSANTGHEKGLASRLPWREETRDVPDRHLDVV
ncbi:MAG: hypothetical protein ABIU05_09735, partial [Nitrospirales bacterium]